MKRCPNCQSQYTDDTLAYCLQDGSPLVEAPLMPTVAFGEQETLVGSRPTNPPFQTGGPQNWQTNPTARPTSPQMAAPNQSRSPFLALAVVVLAVLLISFIGLGVWILIRGGSPYANSNLLLANANTQQSNKPLSSSTPLPQTSRTVSTSQSNTANTTANTAVPVDTEQVKTAVINRLNTWKSNSEARDMNAYMNNYADTIEYYNRRAVSREYVRADKQRAFVKYDSIKITLSNISVKPDASGDRAVAILDKEWTFTNTAGDYNAGKVKQQITLKLVNGQWLIIGENDLKVYYVDK